VSIWIGGAPPVLTWPVGEMPVPDGKIVPRSCSSESITPLAERIAQIIASARYSTRKTQK
jgi:hypothetical protein